MSSSGGEPALPVAVVDGPVSRRYLAVKRLLDVALSLVAIVVLAPLMAAIALAILIDDGNPALFRQDRVGALPRRRRSTVQWELRRFRILKFRTMRAHPGESGLHQAFVRAFVAGELVAESHAGPAFKLADDPRITRVGRWLRATSLDELPQLFNVLEGTMSLVGPRPVPAYEVEGYARDDLRRLAATPGITGLWQVQGRGRVTFREMVRMDVAYVERRSLRLDVRLLWQTLPTVVSAKGAR